MPLCKEQRAIAMANSPLNMIPFLMQHFHQVYLDFHITRVSGAIRPHGHHQAHSDLFRRKILSAYRDQVQRIARVQLRALQTEASIHRAWGCKVRAVVETVRQVRQDSEAADQAQVSRTAIRTTSAKLP